MARTAPTVNGTPVYKLVSFRWMDTTGDKRTDTYQFPAACTAALIETLAAALAADSNAVLYEVDIKEAYAALPDKNDAVNSPRESLFQNIVVLVKTPLNDSDDLFIPAPEDDNFIPNTDDPIVGSIAPTITAFLACKNAGGGTYQSISGRYSERREINKSIPF